jgi:hypothetical protein
MGVLLDFCPSLRSKCLTLSQQARARIEYYSLEKVLDEWLPVEQAIAAEDRVPVSIEVRNLKHLYETRRVSPSIEEDSKIRESVSKLFNTLAQLTACGPRIQVLEVVTVDEQAEKTDLNRAYQSNQEQNIKIVQEDMALVAKAEQLFEKQVPEADPDQKGVRYILPYRHNGVWHCLFRSSKIIYVISVTESREMKVTGRLWYS